MNQKQITQKNSRLAQLEKASEVMTVQDIKLRGRIRKLQSTQEKLRLKRVKNIRERSSIEEQLVLADGECHTHKEGA